MSGNTFFWSDESIKGPRQTSKLPFGPLSTTGRKKMGLTNGVCPSMGSVYCFTQCQNVPHGDCAVLEDSSILAGEDNSVATPCHTCELPCTCRVRLTMLADSHCGHDEAMNLAAQQERTQAHLVWWGQRVATLRGA